MKITRSKSRKMWEPNKKKDSLQNCFCPEGICSYEKIAVTGTEI